MRAEVDRFTQVPSADFDKVALSGRLQYVDPLNDQAYSPYIVYAPRFDFDPFFRERFATRQDLNLGVNKTFNFDADFRRVPFSPNTLDETVWSFGMTVFAQRRFRDPQPSSWAFFVIPSMTYVISETGTSASASRSCSAGSIPTRASRGGVVHRADRHPRIRTAESVVRLGAERHAVRPAGDRPADGLRAELVEHAAFSYSAWHVGAALKLGWRF